MHHCVNSSQVMSDWCQAPQLRKSWHESVRCQFLIGNVRHADAVEVVPEVKGDSVNSSQVMSDARANVHEQEWNDYECQFLIGNVRLDEDFAVDAVDDVDSVNSSQVMSDIKDIVTKGNDSVRTSVNSSQVMSDQKLLNQRK